MAHGSTYSYAPTCSGPVTIAAVQLPAYLTLSNGIISGSPSSPGTSVCEISAYASDGHSYSYQWWNVTVAQWSYAFTDSPSSSAVHGQLWSFTPTLNGPAIDLLPRPAIVLGAL